MYRTVSVVDTELLILEVDPTFEIILDVDLKKFRSHRILIHITAFVICDR